MRLALAASVALAAALRFPFLGHQSLWYDETFTRAIVTSPSLADVWHGVKSTEATPPLYYVVTWLYGKLFGVSSDAGLRTVGALASVATVPVAFAAVRTFVGRRAALATALLVAASPLLIGYVFDARAYSLLVLLSFVSIWAMARVLERPDTRRWLAWSLAAAACIWTHYFGGFLVLAEVCVLFWKSPVRRQVLVWSAVVCALFAPLLSLLAVQTDSRSDYIGTQALATRVKEAARQFAMGPNVPSAALEAAGIVLGVAGFALGLVAIRRRGHPARPLAAVGAIALAIPLVVSASGIADRFLARNALIAWGCVAAIAALGLIRARAVPLALWVTLSVVAALWIQSDWRYLNPDWAGVARVLRARAPRLPVAAYPSFNSPVAARYLQPARITARPVTTSRIWMVLEPARRSGRKLEPLRELPRLPAGFSIAGMRAYRGFRLVELHAPAPAPVAASAFGQDALGRPPAIFLLGG